MRYAESMGGIITNIHYLYGHKYPPISIIYMAIDTFQIKLLLFDTLSCLFQICHILSHIVTNVPYLNTAYGEGKLVLRSGNGVEKVGNFILTKVWEPWNPSHKSNNAPIPYPTLHHFVTEMCTYKVWWRAQFGAIPRSNITWYHMQLCCNLTQMMNQDLNSQASYWVSIVRIWGEIVL